ncbi:MAG: type ISP restriction/modification enzyme [Pseudomonadota bacterium]
MTTTIHSILGEFREAAHSSRDLGDKFERLFANYLVTEPQYRARFKQVWMWSEWPGRGGYGFSKNDTGIDLVAEEHFTGELCAIQCKFYDPDTTIQKADLDSFFATSGKAPFTSRIVVTTTDKWSKHAEPLLEDERVPCIRLRLQDLEGSLVDWSHFSLARPDLMRLKPQKTLRPHQQSALDDVMKGLGEAERGKLIMACGTGKTFTALKIAEGFASDIAVASSAAQRSAAQRSAAQRNYNGRILFLVPSIALLAQSLAEWSAQSSTPLHAFAVCSDTAVGKTGNKASDEDDIRLHDLPFPATTDARKLAKQLAALQGKKPLTVVFSTYQSIATIHEAQTLHGAPAFDLIICDEAHRTTGVTLAGNDESHFVKVHDAAYIQSGKRLYMTATPRIFMDAAKSSAKEADAELCSMDDEALYGRELHRLNFGEAIQQELLTDYKVMVLAVDEKFVSKIFQKELAAAAKAKTDKEFSDYLTDLVKLTGCWNGLAKRMASSADTDLLAADTAPMRRAVAFAKTIAASKQIKELFSGIVEKYVSQAPEDEQASLLRCEADHVDGTMNALQRGRLLDWLKADTGSEGNTCRILSNARCLSEGVDVPALDAVLFLNPRNSIVDVVQSVGRVMRRAEGKKYGYIILPIGIPADTSPEEALKDNDKYKIVWQVLQALRSHDERIEAGINKIDLTGKPPANIEIIGVGGGKGDDDTGTGSPKPKQFTLDFPNLNEWRDAIFAKIVLKCGDRRYWESWARDVGEIAEKQITRIKALLDLPETGAREAFAPFLTGLRQNLNPAVSEADAVEMLAQHLITQPVFDALFENYAFSAQNPVSQAMQAMLDVLHANGLDKHAASLEKFYASVRLRAGGISNPEARQKIIVELYDKFFRTAFPRMAERLGIVYTPVEVVDFILKSVDDTLQAEFGQSLSSEGVQVLDPFTGTGTFIVRLLQGGFVKPEDLARKYASELHANELVLLAYYIAAVNIEATYHGQLQAAGQTADYKPFEGIVLTDTFQLTEGKGTLESALFPDNNARAVKQKEADIRVIVGNPPYSVGQESANDNNQNLKYPHLDERIESTYVAGSNATNKSSLYNSYIRAIRWASDRISDKGIVCFVTNGGFIEGKSAAGLRRCMAEEFTGVYVFNLRGLRGQKTSGEKAKQEGGQIFGSGNATTIAIFLLVKNPDRNCTGHINYRDIGDYLSRSEKLKIINQSESIKHISWQYLTPDTHGDWINFRDPAFDSFAALSESHASIFSMRSRGVETSRNEWVYSYSSVNLEENICRMIDFYNSQIELLGKTLAAITGHEARAIKCSQLIESDPRKIKWTRGLKEDLCRGRRSKYSREKVGVSLFRPYSKSWLYYDAQFNEYYKEKYFPTAHHKNIAISIIGVADRKGFSALITDVIPDLHLLDTGQCFPLYHYEETTGKADLLNAAAEPGWVRREAITDAAIAAFRSAYAGRASASGKGAGEIGKEDLFYYVYGILHSPEYKTRFEADLKKQLPRIPYAADFWAFSTAGRELAHWHLNYETVDAYPLAQQGELDMGTPDHYRVQKMAYAKRRVDGKLQEDKTTLIYNSRITLTGIPPAALDYIVNGKPALEWVMERYAVTTDKDSGIKNDPNDWATEHNDPQYILNLVKRVMRVSVETVRIVAGLPALQEFQADSKG